MKNGDKVGYEMWKVAVYPNNKELEDLSCAELLYSLIEANIQFHFAININQEFEAKFNGVVKNIKHYMRETYRDNTLDIEKNPEKYEDEVLEEIKSVIPFIEWLKEKQSISVQHIEFEQEKPYFYIALTFPNEESKQLMLTKLKGRKNFTSGPFQGRDCPTMDDKNPSVLKFYGVTGENGSQNLRFPDEDMASYLFNSLPALTELLGIQSYEEPFITNPLGQTVSRIACPEYLLGYSRLLLVAKFPELINPGALYVEIKEDFKGIALKSISIPKSQALSSDELEKFKKALDVDEIKVNFEHLKYGITLDIALNKNTFTVAREICGPSPSAFTTKHGLKPQKTFYGYSMLPPGQASSLQVIEEAVRQTEYKRVGELSTRALESVKEQITKKLQLQQSCQKAEEEKKKIEMELKSLSIEKEGAIGLGKIRTILTIFPKSKGEPKNKFDQVNIDELEQKRIDLESCHKKIIFTLEQLHAELTTQEQETNKALWEYSLFTQNLKSLGSQSRLSSGNSASPRKEDSSRRTMGL